MDECLVNEAQIYTFLKSLDRFDDAKQTLLVFKVGGDEYHLHVDVNEEHDKYRYMYEWWVENSAGYVDGGFEPANSDDELHTLARVILQAVNSCMNKAAGLP